MDYLLVCGFQYIPYNRWKVKRPSKEKSGPPPAAFSKTFPREKRFLERMIAPGFCVFWTGFGETSKKSAVFSHL